MLLFCKCLGNLSFNDESAGIEANPIFFSSIRSRGGALRYLFSFELHYCCTSNKINPKMTLSIRQSYLSKIIHHSFSEFRKTDIGEHLSVLNNDIQLIESNGFSSIYTLCSTVLPLCFNYCLIKL